VLWTRVEPRRLLTYGKESSIIFSRCRAVW